MAEWRHVSREALALQLLEAAEERAQRLTELAAEHGAALAEARASLERRAAPEGTGVDALATLGGGLVSAGEGVDVGTVLGYGGCGTRPPRRSSSSAALQAVLVNGDARSVSKSTQDAPSWKSELPEMLQCWKAHPGLPADKRTSSGHLKALSGSKLGHHHWHGHGTRGSEASRFVLAPTARVRTVWDCASAVVIAYDVMTFPLGAFAYTDWKPSVMMNWVCLLFWTVDLPLSFFSGYFRDDGLMECRLAFAAMKYVKTWFPFDIMVISVDWTMKAFETNGQASRMARLNKVARFMRISKALRFGRLLRVVKLKGLCADISVMIMSSQTLAASKLLKLLAIMAVVLHYIACAWYLLGRTSGEPHETWLGEWIDRGFSQMDFYLISFHWAIAQFTPAPISIAPVNQQERAFNVCAVLLGVAVVSSIIGSLTAVISQFRQKAAEKIEDEDNLRKFLQDNDVTLELRRRITHFFAQAQGKGGRVTEDMLPLLNVLPGYLRIDMRYEVHMHKLSVSPVLTCLKDAHEHVLKGVCDSGVVERTVDNGSTPFYSDTECASLYFLLQGRFAYYSEVENNTQVQSQVGTMNNGVSNGVSPVHHVESHYLHPGEYLCEPALWCQWMHQGQLQASSNGMLLVLSTTAFSKIVAKHRGALSFCCEHAGVYIHCMQERRSQGEVVDDLFHPFEDQDAVMSTMREMGL